MNKTAYCLITMLSLFVTCTVQADTIELADGTLLEGDFIGSSNGIIMFNTGGSIEAFPEDKVVGIFLSAGVATKEAMSADSVTVPTGTRLVIRTADTIDSSRHSAGHRFTGQLEGALVVDGVTVAPRGAYVHGRITQAGQARRLVGSSELALEFTDILINDQLVPISTTSLQAQTGNEAARTVGRTARSAAIGGLIGGSSGARTGARVGAGASILTSGASINVPAGTIIETTLAAPLEVQQ
ncbi:MAG: hypothetical protein QNK19_12300 [Xanthomonadales bacterium]|nr:hypothetical protein [Xanthomonadales bacterium]